jgi:hypothetical protein
MSRAAVVVNPTKLDDDEAFRKSVRRVMDDHGWDEPFWLETTPEDPGRGQAESAVSAGIGLVLACGGDGTVTACAEGSSVNGGVMCQIVSRPAGREARSPGLSISVGPSAISMATSPWSTWIVSRWAGVHGPGPPAEGN